MDGRGSIPGRGKIFVLLYNVRAGFGAHPDSNPIGIGGPFLGVNAAGE
jgi:hypothetical protein